MEHIKRLDILYRQHHEWLMQVAFNVCRDKEISEDLVSDLYLYLAERKDKNLYYNNSYNLMYCLSFIKSRFINRTKIMNRNESLSDNYESVDEQYDVEFDEQLEKTYEDIKTILKDLQGTKMWASAKLAEIYFYTDATFVSMAKDIDISKSTAFLNVKKIRDYLKTNVTNPFN